LYGEVGDIIRIADDAYEILNVPIKYKTNISGSQTSLIAATIEAIIIIITHHRRAQCNYRMRIVSIVCNPEMVGCGRQKCDPTG
jgi:hypothetical protein